MSERLISLQFETIFTITEKEFKGLMSNLTMKMHLVDCGMEKYSLEDRIIGNLLRGSRFRYLDIKLERESEE